MAPLQRCFAIQQLHTRTHPYDTLGSVESRVDQANHKQYCSGFG